jgi:hypothetical protein
MSTVSLTSSLWSVATITIELRLAEEAGACSNLQTCEWVLDIEGLTTLKVGVGRSWSLNTSLVD